MAASAWPSEWQRGLLSAAVLGILERHPLHGYGIAQELERYGWGTIPGGTLYPALRVLEAKGLVMGAWRPVERGPARKYYRLTEAGLSLLAQQRGQWDALSQSMMQILGKEADRDE